MKQLLDIVLRKNKALKREFIFITFNIFLMDRFNKVFLFLEQANEVLGVLIKFMHDVLCN